MKSYNQFLAIAGEPASTREKIAAHTLGLPFHYGGETGAEGVYRELIHILRPSQVDPDWLTFNRPILDVLLYTDALGGAIGGLTQKLLTHNTRDYDELEVIMKEMVCFAAAAYPSVSYPPAPTMEARVWSRPSLRRQLRNPKLTDLRNGRYECTDLLLRYAINMLAEGSWQVKPPEIITIKSGLKTRTCYNFVVPLDHILLTLINIIGQISFGPWPENSHAYIPGRGIYTAIDAIKRAVSSGNYLFQTFDYEKAFQSIHRGRVTQFCASAFGEQARQATAGIGPPIHPILAAEHLARTILNINFAKDKKTGKLIKVTDGLLQGSPVAPLLFNLIMRKLDKVLLEIYSKGGPGVERYADNFLAFGSHESALGDAYARISNHGHGFGVNTRIEVDPINIFETASPLEWLGVEIFIKNKRKKGGLKYEYIIRPGKKSLKRLAEAVRYAGSTRMVNAYLNHFMSHYGAAGWIDDAMCKRLADLLGRAVNANTTVSNAKRVREMVSYEHLNRLWVRFR